MLPPNLHHAMIWCALLPPLGVRVVIWVVAGSRKKSSRNRTTLDFFIRFGFRIPDPVNTATAFRRCGDDLRGSRVKKILKM
jgi:hypothetical protein